ncbi:formate dehydrogenase subunit gamma [Shewanella sp. D64]|uniref:formate dehydrogenase subunit gamma n=1 Tax=unclassified Shewanella TaxID=196818 RepID=UPI0022BA6D5B|nr:MULTISPECIES: formate dehydrogenase subunit gamma [unclassified Shewanella]MEC4726264.1 formate dehydrogenase subunit gamma [Shewanella sp. D64]MEC4738276.1 formate dehydrogenase subunit gamma [Shewanella sp. E94]WBJ95414.1 formate dehydrogenase subunit gamma [Shewanella sp. MTB7]
MFTHKCKQLVLALFAVLIWALGSSTVAFAVEEPLDQAQIEQSLLQQQQQVIAAEQLQIQLLQANPQTATADLWRGIREGETGFTHSQDAGAGRLINAFGNDGRLVRNEYVVPALAIAVVGVFGLFLLFYLINGSTKLSHGFSGKLVRRWTRADMWLHWAMAVSCLAMMFTGLTIMLGRYVLEPMVSSDIWAPLIYGGKTIHDWTGPLFILFWAICILKWMPVQTFKSYDLKWFLLVGGYINFGPFKGKHPDSGFANAGEKMWFWTLVLFGLSISITGILLVLPDLDLSRETSMLSLLIHGSSSVILIGFTIVHIWMATVLSEGGLESMSSGYCDENWAVQHHNLWYDEIKANGTLEYKE